MRRLVFAALLGLTLTSTVGCLIPAYSGDPAVRTQELIFTSENMRHDSAGMGADLVPRLTGSHDPPAYSRRRDIVAA